MKKKFKTVFDETIVLFDTILVSGGRVGTQVEVNPDDILAVTDGTAAAIAREE
jgi:Cys-tRNA(Pro)/Cys-tRNA(Cys) deacylase